ncbi:MAG TPA: hypothetical protein VIX35_08535 [Vicinamibacterales bacterium]
MASATGRWTPALEAHAAACPMCRDVKTVTSALAAPLAASPLTIDPVLLWARARHAAHVAAAARMSKILTTTQVLAAALVLAVFVYFFRWPDVQPAARPPDTNTLLVAAGALLTAATVWLSRWATRP